ncbi:MAG: hypothetical protein ACLUAR_16800 [Pilosibacter sp.]
MILDAVFGIGLSSKCGRCVHVPIDWINRNEDMKTIRRGHSLPASSSHDTGEALRTRSARM